MKSPFTGGETRLVSETRTAVFRKEEFTYNHLCYECVDTNERFTTTQLDTVNTNQVYNMYRVKYGIPFADEIRSVRQKYGLSASKMSQVLGFGENQIRLYENGDVPNVAQGRVLRSIVSPDAFKIFVESAKNTLTGKEFEKIMSKIQSCKMRDDDSLIHDMIFGSQERGIYNGFAQQSLSKLKNIMLYYIGKFDGVFTTLMNKLLFYTDFLAYRETGVGITGLSYVAIPYGPVPEGWARIYSLMSDIEQEEIVCSNGNVGYVLKSEMSCDKDCFTDEQMEILDRIYAVFKKETPSSISRISHEEDGWKDNVDCRSAIDYQYAFRLKAV